MRSSAVMKNARLYISAGENILAEKDLHYVKPAEMISYTLEAEKSAALADDAHIKVKLVPLDEEGK